MITSVEARTPRGDLLVMTLLDTDEGILITNIDGLDPVKANISTSPYARRDGVQYQNSQRGERNIIITFDLEPDYLENGVSDLRDQLYAFFMTGMATDLRIYTDTGKVVDAFGRVESCDTAYFSDEPQVVVSVLCFDPDLTDTTPTALSGSTVSTLSETLRTYSGSMAAGFTFVLNVNRTLTDFSIYNRASDNTLQKLDFSAALVSGDTVTISTVPGSMGAFLTRSGVKSSLLYAVSTQSNWISLRPGANYIRVYATGAAVPYTMTYTNRYGGL